jgi:creatine kinase
MGAGASVSSTAGKLTTGLTATLAEETAKPVDASDIEGEEALKAEVTRLRTLIKDASPDGVSLSAVVDVGEDNYPRWFRKSVSGTTLTPELYNKFCNKIGPRGFTFDMAIQCGIDTKSGTGCAIPDSESYYLWQEWYDAMIDARHGHAPGAKHITDLDYSGIDSSQLPADLDDYCVSTRIRAARNIAGFGLPPASTRAERREVERIVKEGLATLEGELAGTYYSLTDMTDEQSAQLQEDHFLFQIPNPSAMIFGCGGCRDWPDARGIFHNEAKQFLVWVNEEDQMRVISMQSGGNVVEVFKRWADGVNAVEAVVKAAGHEYMYDDHLGMFSSCVSNVGTGLRASMHILLPGLVEALGMDGLSAFAKTMEMDCRGVGGEHTGAGEGGRVDMSNKKRIGRSEVQLVQTMVDGICNLIALEKRCQAGESDAVKAEIAAPAPAAEAAAPAAKVAEEAPPAAEEATK